MRKLWRVIWTMYIKPALLDEEPHLEMKPKWMWDDYFEKRRLS